MHAHRIRRVLVPALVGLLALGELATGAVAAADQRAEHARAARAAAEKRAAAAYVRHVEPLSNRVYDAVQPLQDAADAFAHPRPGLEEARDDVLAHSGAAEELKAVQRDLGVTVPPRTYRAAQAKLASALSSLVSAADALAAATRARGDAHGYVAAFGKGYDLLYIAEGSWSGALSLLSVPQPLPAPAGNAALAYGRKTPTRGRFIETSDLACGKGIMAAARLPDGSSVDMVRNSFPRLARIMRSTAAALQAVPAPADRSAVQHRLGVQLQGSATFATALERLSAAVRSHDGRAYSAALDDFNDSLAALRELSRTYRAEGVTLCADLFDVDENGRSKQPEKLST